MIHSSAALESLPLLSGNRILRYDTTSTSGGSVCLKSYEWAAIRVPCDLNLRVAASFLSSATKVI